MKKVKKLLSLLVAFAMTLCIFAMAACDTPTTGGDEHVCEHVCETCDKCTDKDCDDPVCEDKCEGHEPPAPGHECKDECPTCGKCTSECDDPECSDKCEGHGDPEPEHKCEHICTEPDCGLCTDNECTDEVCKNKCPGHGEPEPDHECEDKCPICDKCTSECDKPECEEKCEGHIFTITLEVGEGTLPAGAQATYQTSKDGKIVGILPEPTISKAHWSFDDWYDEEGNPVVEATTVFTKDTTLTAKYVRDNGVWKNNGENLGEVFIRSITRNTGASDSGLIAEYWMGGSKIDVEVGDKLSLYLEGKLVSHYVQSGAIGVESPVSSSQKADYVTVTVAGQLEFYLKLYTSSTDPDNWSCQWLGASEVGQGSQEEIAGCAPIHITWGSNSITFYLKDVNGDPVGEDDLSKFALYTYSPTLFGTDWNSSTTAGKLSKEMTSAQTAMPTGWIFRWGSFSGDANQTADILTSGNKMVSGGVYLVELVAKTKGVSKVTAITL